MAIGNTRAARFLTLGGEIVVVTGGMIYFGWWLDERWRTSPWMTLIGGLLGMAAVVSRLISLAKTRS